MINGHWTLIIRPLPGSNSVAHDVVYGELDELRAVIPSALILRTHVREPALDVRHLERAQLILQIEMLRDQGFDLLADSGT